MIWQRRACCLILFLIVVLQKFKQIEARPYCTKKTQLQLLVKGGGDLSSSAWRTPAAPTSKSWMSKGYQREPTKSHYKVEEIVKPLDELLDRSSRTVFIRRVYGLLGASLSTTALSCLFCASNPRLIFSLISQPAGRFFLALVAIFSFIGPLSLAFSPALRRDPSKAIPIFALFTMSEASLVGIACTAYRLQTVILAISQTAIASLALTAYGFQPNPKYDLTGFGSVLFSSLLLLSVSAIAGTLFKVQPAPLLYSTVGALIFSAFIVYDTQLIVGGKKKKCAA
mmetsp:Transcript_9569/g.13239  ORF Transcript_9569/g.13239 Transcript_9569/m.13239 type:complete len:283 (-) Transcript_9569:150-998(-)